MPRDETDWEWETLHLRIIQYMENAVLSSVSNSSKFPGQFRVRFRPATKPFEWVLPHETRTMAIGLVLPPKTRHFHIKSVAPIKYLSSDRIMTQSTRKLCSYMRSFTSRFQICDTTNIHWVTTENQRILLQIWGYFTDILRILVGFQIWKREVKEHIKLHNLRIDHVTIWSELKYLIKAKCIGSI